MNCPFLKETEVKFCGSSAVGKMIVKSPLASGDEKCSTSTYSGCEVYKSFRETRGLPVPLSADPANSGAVSRGSPDREVHPLHGIRAFTLWQRQPSLLRSFYCHSEPE